MSASSTRQLVRERDYRACEHIVKLTAGFRSCPRITKLAIDLIDLVARGCYIGERVGVSVVLLQRRSFAHLAHLVDKLVHHPAVVFGSYLAT